MRKGFFASVAALASGAGVALAQGGPGGPPPGPGGYPAWAGPAAPGAMPPGGYPPSAGGYPGGPGGYPAGPGGYPGGPGGMPAWAGQGMPGGMPGGMPPGDPNGFTSAPGGYPGGPNPTGVPPATEMPLNGQVPGPDCQHPINPGAKPKFGTEVGQVHKAAGGPDKWWFNIEENVWTIRSMSVPIPLLAIGPAGGNAILGVPGTVPLLGDQNLERHEYFNVLRISGGWWDCNRVWGVEASAFVSEQRTQNFDFAFSSQGDTVLARPFIDANRGVPSSLLIEVPGQFGGVAHVDTRFHMGGAELNLLKDLIYCDQVKANLLGGFRYVDTTESLDIESTSTLPNLANGANPLVSTIGDSFRTHNQFIGGQIGFEAELRRGRIFLDMTGKIAAGDMHERLQATGFSTSGTVSGLTSTTTPGGLLVLPTNGGKFSRDEFAYVPEGSINLGYQWTQRISTYAGFNYLYLSRVLRPGDQIDPVVNPNLVPVSSTFGQNFGPRQPEPVLRQSDFWTAGVTFGLSIRY